MTDQDRARPVPPPFDFDDWCRRYRAATVASEEALQRVDAARHDALLDIPPADRSAEDVADLARLRAEVAAALAPLGTLLHEFAGAHPGRDYYPARDPNRPPAWPPEITARLRFARCEEKVACARCGKRRKRHWTMLVPFRAAVFGAFSLDMGDQVFYPLTLVCADHPLEPASLPPEVS